MSEQAGPQGFEHKGSFQQGEIGGQLRLDHYEPYRELLTEVIADGVITQDERASLQAKAAELGLDPGRLRQLERALTRAYQDHHGKAVLDTGAMFGAPPEVGLSQPEAEGRPTLPSPQAAGAAFDELGRLRARVAELEQQVAALSGELEQARLAVDIDLSDLAPAGGDDPTTLHNRLRQDPRDVDLLHALFAAVDDEDRRLRVAEALCFLGAQNDEERALCARHRSHDLIAPERSLEPSGWRTMLSHPDDDPLTAAILGVIAPAVLLGQVSALGQRGAPPEIDPARRLDPATSTAQAARCFGWAAQILGMPAPALYADPARDTVASLTVAMPPWTCLGKQALSGREPRELAFVAGRQLALMRQELFMRLIAPDVVDLEDLFWAALLIANRGLPLRSDQRGRVEPLADAIEPLLQPAEADQLRAAFSRFVEQGGRTNLMRWAAGADRTAARAGFSLCGDLAIAERMLRLQGVQDVDDTVDDLLVYATGERYGKLRAALGVGAAS